MHPLAFKLLRRLRDPGNPLSRNRSLETFASPEGRAALRAHRLLRSLERDLERLEDSSDLRLHHEAGRVRIAIDRPSLRLRREAVLEARAFGLLILSERTGPLLRLAAERDAPELVPDPRGDR
ncbi:MAG: hypothetical protein P1V51_21005 [Deltaproteobacteria bacterium]|nr:hypothetical protein [Deltaproteobacteria bacterium]